jgi:hypothetical protein
MRLQATSEKPISGNVLDRKHQYYWRKATAFPFGDGAEFALASHP